MKLKISGNGYYQIVDNKINSRVGDKFVVKEENGCISISNSFNNSSCNSSINISGDGDIIISNSFSGNSGCSIKINGLDITETLNNMSNVEQEEGISEYVFTETINEIILSGNTELKIMNETVLDKNLNLICSGNSYLNISDRKLENIISIFSGNSKLSISNSKLNTLVSTCSGCSTLKCVNSTIENLIFCGSGSSTLIKDKSNFNNFQKNFSGVSSLKEIN